MQVIITKFQKLCDAPTANLLRCSTDEIPHFKIHEQQV
uniref:Uncharacterized protein n=1 Tax=Rhizophora mucronata TaxID=61149 RepID=A0A2P2Q6D6_RHIMU